MVVEVRGIAPLGLNFYTRTTQDNPTSALLYIACAQIPHKTISCFFREPIACAIPGKLKICRVLQITMEICEAGVSAASQPLRERWRHSRQRTQLPHAKRTLHLLVYKCLFYEAKHLIGSRKKSWAEQRLCKIKRSEIFIRRKKPSLPRGFCLCFTKWLPYRNLKNSFFSC